jgi:predicted unusual protein kinase regulating ubiquinone biosynthesis (AarF/ABC1/UbiB family)
MLMPDGRVVFMDFGMTKRIPAAQIEQETAVIRAGLAGDAQQLHARLVGLGFYEADDPAVDPDRLLAHVQSLQGWYAEDREFTITRQYVSRIMVDAGDPRSEYWDLMKRGTLPADALLARRMEALTLGVLGQLDATANWHRIMSEWLYAGPPATPLGEAEADFHFRRPTRRAA